MTRKPKSKPARKARSLPTTVHQAVVVPRDPIAHARSIQALYGIGDGNSKILPERFVRALARASIGVGLQRREINGEEMAVVPPYVVAASQLVETEAFQEAAFVRLVDILLRDPDAREGLGAIRDLAADGERTFHKAIEAAARALSTRAVALLARPPREEP